jgi:tRNA threonylcarbamoyladenosine biosynthesis protein TsaE
MMKSTLNTIQNKPAAFNVRLENESDTVTIGQTLVALLTKYIQQHGLVVYLLGDLGVGKTTLARGIIKSKGWQGAVKSPTYTLVEPYEFEEFTINHFDLYRLAEPEELEYMGIRDYFNEKTLNLIEWPSKGVGFLPESDLILELTDIELEHGKQGRQLSVFSQNIDILKALSSLNG